MISVNHLLTVFNSAFNFLIYWSFCCGKRRRRRSRRQRMLLSQKTQHSFEMQASVANEATLLRRSRHDTGNGNHSHIVPSQACQLRIIAFHSGEHAIQAAASSPTSMGSVTNNANDILRTRGGGGGGGEGDNVGKIEQPQTCVHPEIFLPTLPKLFGRG